MKNLLNLIMDCPWQNWAVYVSFLFLAVVYVAKAAKAHARYLWSKCSKNKHFIQPGDGEAFFNIFKVMPVTITAMTVVLMWNNLKILITFDGMMLFATLLIITAAIASFFAFVVFKIITCREMKRVYKVHCLLKYLREDADEDENVDEKETPK